MEINIRALKALSCFCAKSEVRYYLNGIYIETVHGGIVATATDGHILGSVRQTTDNTGYTGAFLLPIALMDRIKLIRNDNYADLSVKDGLITILYGNTTYCEKEIDATYPDWRHTVNGVSTENAGKMAQFDPALVTRIHKAAITWAERKNVKIKIHHAGEGPALVNWMEPELTDRKHCEGFGIIMPFRDNTEFTKPSWINDPVIHPYVEI